MQLYDTSLIGHIKRHRTLYGEIAVVGVIAVIILGTVTFLAAQDPGAHGVSAYLDSIIHGDPVVYWFMFPACIIIAAVAMFSGISGAAMLIPVFLIGFPLANVPQLSTVEAIGMSLVLETSGFGTGVYRYTKRKMIDTVTARSIIVVTLPLGALGAVAAQVAPSNALHIIYGTAMLGLAWLLAREALHRRNIGNVSHVISQPPASQSTEMTDGQSRPDLSAASSSDHPADTAYYNRTITTTDGISYQYYAKGLGLQRLFSGSGAFAAGLISTGVGELTLPILVRRSHFPVPIAAATSTVIVAATVIGAAITHLLLLATGDGLTAIPWNLLIWAVPGAIIGALIGTWLQGRINENSARWFFSGLFAVIGVVFLAAFTIFADYIS